jgi:hypothetical protein
MSMEKSMQRLQKKDHIWSLSANTDAHGGAYFIFLSAKLTVVDHRVVT